MNIKAILCLVLIVLSVAVVGGISTYCSRGHNNTIAEYVSFEGAETGGVTLIAAQGYNYNPRGFAHT